MELVTGPKGNAILVRKEQIQTLDHLYHALWTILGRFYMIATQPATPDRQGEAEKPEVVEIATDFWTVFAPEAVSYRVERFLINSTGKGGSFEWTEAEWRSIANELHIQLMKVYGQRGIRSQHARSNASTPMLRLSLLLLSRTKPRSLERAQPVK